MLQGGSHPELPLCWLHRLLFSPPTGARRSARTPVNDCHASPCCQTFYNEAAVSCCPDTGYDGYDANSKHNQIDLPGLNNLDIGTCQGTFQTFDTPVFLTDDMVKTSTFTAVCNLKSGGQCGHPFCDSMVLTFTGVGYGLRTVVSATPPVVPPVDESCAGPPGKRKGDGQQRGGLNGFGSYPSSSAIFPKAWADKTNKAKKADAAHTAYHKDGPTTYYASDAFMATGPVTITSTKYNIKHYEGYMDYVSMNPNTTSLTPAEAAGLHLVNPFTLQVKKPREQY